MKPLSWAHLEHNWRSSAELGGK